MTFMFRIAITQIQFFLRFLYSIFPFCTLLRFRQAKLFFPLMISSIATLRTMLSISPPEKSYATASCSASSQESQFSFSCQIAVFACALGFSNFILYKNLRSKAASRFAARFVVTIKMPSIFFMNNAEF